MTGTPTPSIEERLAALEVLGTVPVILGPGETLIIRVTDLTPNQIREYQDDLDYREADGILPFRAIVVYGNELAAARTADGPEPAEAAHPHLWAARPVTSPVFSWKCADSACGEVVTMGWRTEWAGLGFEDIERAMLAECGGRILPGTRNPGALIPFDLETHASRIWPMFPHEHLAVGDVFEVKRDGQPCALRVTEVIPGPDGQVMYDTEPA